MVDDDHLAVHDLAQQIALAARSRVVVIGDDQGVRLLVEEDPAQADRRAAVDVDRIRI